MARSLVGGVALALLGASSAAGTPASKAPATRPTPPAQCTQFGPAACLAFSSALNNLTSLTAETSKVTAETSKSVASCDWTSNDFATFSGTCASFDFTRMVSLPVLNSYEVFLSTSPGTPAEAKGIRAPLVKTTEYVKGIVFFEHEPPNRACAAFMYRINFVSSRPGGSYIDVCLGPWSQTVVHSRTVSSTIFQASHDRNGTCVNGNVTKNKFGLCAAVPFGLYNTYSVPPDVNGNLSNSYYVSGGSGCKGCPIKKFMDYANYDPPAGTEPPCARSQAKIVTPNEYHFSRDGGATWIKGARVYHHPANRPALLVVGVLLSLLLTILQ